MDVDRYTLGVALFASLGTFLYVSYSNSEGDLYLHYCWIVR
jgi:hypothetical protein